MWLTEFRKAHGLSIEQLGHAVRMRGKTLDPPIFIRDTTIMKLEREPGYLVIPAFANLIAEVCGATAEQRDALTLPKHAGTWRPTGMPAKELIHAGAEKAEKKAQKKPQAPKASPERVCAAMPLGGGGPRSGGGVDTRLPVAATNALARAIQQPTDHSRDTNRGRPVVAIDTDGKVLATYLGPFHAAHRNGISKDMVLRRCLRRMKSNEFAGLKYTFRFKDEWDRMSEEERRADLDRTKWWRAAPSVARIRTECPRKGHFRRAVVVIDPEGHELGRYTCARDAAEAMGEAYSSMMHHVTMARGYTSHYTRRGKGYFYADVWDDMSEDAKAAATLRGKRHHPAQAGGK